MNAVFLKSMLEKAILGDDYCMIDYVDAKGAITSDRLVRPIQVKNDAQGRLVLHADCELRKGFRPFLFEGIMKCKVIPLPEAMEILGVK